MAAIPPSSHPLVSVVIPAYNRRDSVLALLADIFQQEGTAFEVIVVDDCSPDDTVEAIRQRFPQTIVLRNEKNGGPAVSRNRGIREARGTFVVGFDSDVTVPDRGLLARAAETFERFPDVTGLAFRLLSPDGKTDDAPRWWHPVPIERHANSRFMTDYFSGTGYAFRRAEVIDTGMFPEILYMHYEEVGFAYRVLNKGGSIMHCPDLPVLHHANPIASRSKIKVFYKPRNQVLMALAHYTWPRAVAYLVPRLVYNFFASIICGHPGEFIGAMASARKLAPQVLAERDPLTRETRKRIREMRRGSPPLSPSLHPAET